MGKYQAKYLYAIRKSDFFFLLALLLLMSCKMETIHHEIPQISSGQLKEIDNPDDYFLQHWHHKDIIDDSIPGISLEKAYTKLLKNKKGETVTVAVIDMEIDIDHEDLKDNIWKNADEIPNNNTDDDNNGYIDDIHGWNFLGNTKGENIIYANYEYVRIVKRFDSIFKDKTPNDLLPEQQKDFLTYKRAKEKYDKRMAYALEDKRNGDLLYDGYYLAKKELLTYFPQENYTVEKLDSLKKKLPDNEKLQEHIVLLTDCLKYDLNETYINDYKSRADGRVNKLLNQEYNERELLGDDPEDITDIGYGNNILNANKEKLHHGTRIAGIIAASRANTTGAMGILENVNIMPLCIFPYGDEHDKDVALAIRYAVDNGAKVINMSSSKEFSLHLDWVHDAIKYAADHDVLIITSAGNDNYNLDKEDTFNYPEDSLEDGTEFTDNFIKVGSTVYSKELKRSDSNYGKNKVDIFAPGINIYTTSPQKDEDYTYSGGTSAAAPIVSGVAALIRSYYPELSASQIKEIILQSGVSYNLDIEIKQEDDTKKTLPFSELSKSGKVVNAYNALLMAEKKAK